MEFKHLLITSVLMLTLSTCKDSGILVNGVQPCPPLEIVPQPAYDSPIWHPSGQFIGFNHTPLREIEYPYGEHCLGVQRFAGDSAGFWLINPDGTNKRRIFPYKLQRPAWSPDGEWIAFTIPIGGEVHLFRMRFTGTTFDTTTVVQLTVEGRNFFPAWSPDGQWITYDRSLADSTGPGGIWVMRYDGSMKHALFGGVFSAWHPNGNILLGVIGTSPASIWTRFVRYDFLQSKPMDTLSAAIGNDNRNPRYSPDGNKIAFWSNSNLWMMDSTGSNLRQLTTHGVDVSFGLPFSWSPTGDKIVYTHYRTDWTMKNGVLWLLDVNSGTASQLTFNP